MPLDLETLPPIAPLQFFSAGCDLLYAKELPLGRKFILPDASELLREEPFATVRMAWNEKGLLFEFEIAKPFEEALYPDYQKGDSIELFIDTRDLKTAGFPTRFCHHFLILPQSVEGIESQEITRFRTDDTHPLADSDLIFCDTEFSKNAQRIRIRIASEALHGYDPLSFDRLGFNYRINRPGGEPGHFVLSSNVANPAGHPSLWASMKLIKK